MRIADIQNIINDGGGDSRVLGFIFNNISKKVFKRDEFVFEEVFLIIGAENTEVIKMEEEDNKGNVYYVYKPVDTLESIIMVPEPTVIDIIEKRYIFA